MIIIGVLLVSAVARIRRLNNSQEGDGVEIVETETFWKIMIDQLARFIAFCYFIFKFILFASYYRCTDTGNTMERTSSFFWARNVLDVLILYSIVIYIVYVEQ